MTTVFLLISLLGCLPIQDSKHPAGQDNEPTTSVCSQPSPERDDLIREAEAHQFVINFVYFVGNERTRDYVLRRRLINLAEGDVFARANLVKSLGSVSKLKKIINPVTLSDVTVRLNRSEKIVDLAICFKEKQR